MSSLADVNVNVVTPPTVCVDTVVAPAPVNWKSPAVTAPLLAPSLVIVSLSTLATVIVFPA